jgi:hypothetical protein
MPITGIADGEDFIVGSRRHVQRVTKRIVSQAGRTDDHSGGIGLVSIPGADLSLVDHGNPGTGYGEIQSCDGAAQDVADEYLRLRSLVVDG